MTQTNSVPNKTPASSQQPGLEERQTLALEKIAAELEALNQFVVVFPELLISQAIIINRGAQAPEEVVRQASKFTDAFFGHFGVGDQVDQAA